MKHLKKFNEDFNTSYGDGTPSRQYRNRTISGEIDEDYILYNMKKLHGWGDLNPQLLEEFENSDYYSGTKINDEYVEEFHKYMTDIQFGNHMDGEDDIHESFHLNESSYPTLDQVENADHEQICSWYRHLPSPGDGIDFDSDNYKEEIEKQVEIMKVICDKYKNGGGFNSTLSKKIGW
jgi:hypothetical protein